jgi:manganese transport protein
MNRNGHIDTSLSEVHQSVDTNAAGRVKWKRMLSFFGPAYLVSVGYMDPGNWATDLAGGSQFGYSLLWVLLMSNLMALLLQSLSARLGIVHGRDLAQANREAYPKYINLALYLLAEVAIAACDLAEVLGMAIGIQLLTGLPLLYAVLITVFDTFLFLLLQRLGIRKMEAFIICLVGIIGISFLTEIILAKPNLAEVATGLAPVIKNDAALYIAIGIIGATVMPHNLYLHSALVQTRKFKRDEKGIKRALKLNFIDSTIALNLAFFVNAAILVLAATVFFKSGRNVTEIKQAHQLLNDFLGTNLAPKLFAIALIASGQSSTITGTLAGQIVMEGYLRLRINPWIRRLMTRLIAIIPAVIVILVNGEDNIDSLLILSQVILSLQLGFAVIPLIHFVSDKKLMGRFTIKPATRIVAWLVAVILVFLNLRMVFGQSLDYFKTPGHIFWKMLITSGGILFVALLVVAFAYPLITKLKQRRAFDMHETTGQVKNIPLPVFDRIAVALEFSEKDDKLLSYALGQSNKKSSFILIHIVESATAKVLRRETDDLESRKDKERLDNYAERLRQMGYEANGVLGFDRRAKEIVRITKENNADMLVIGAHGHAGIKDWVYGQTIDSVRHELKIPVLIVNV